MHSTSSPAASFSFIDFSEMRSPLAIEVRRAIGCGPIAPQGQRSPRGRRGCLRRGGARVRGRRGAMGYGFPRPRPAWRRLDRLDQLGHLRRKRVPGQHRAGIDDDKQKSLILPLAARSPPRRVDPRLGSRRRARTLCARRRRRRHPRRSAPVGGGVAVGVEGDAGRQGFASFGASNTSPHINDGCQCRRSPARPPTESRRRSGYDTRAHQQMPYWVARQERLTKY